MSKIRVFDLICSFLNINFHYYFKECFSRNICLENQAGRETEERGLGLPNEFTSSGCVFVRDRFKSKKIVRFNNYI